MLLAKLAGAATGCDEVEKSPLPSHIAQLLPNRAERENLPVDRSGGGGNRLQGIPTIRVSRHPELHVVRLAVHGVPNVWLMYPGPFPARSMLREPFWGCQ